MTVTNIIDPITEREARAAMTEALTEFKSSVSHFERAWGIVLDALDRGAHIALGYRSESDLIAHEFDGYLNALDVANRRVVVRELSSRGASQRAIASVVGVSKGSVYNDQQTGAQSWAPEPTVNTETGEVSDDYLPDDATGEEVTSSTEATDTGSDPAVLADDVEEAPGEEVEPPLTPAPSRPVVGIDGKTYTRREPTKPRRKALTDSFWTAAYDMGKRIESVHRLTQDDRFPQNAEKVAAAHRNDLIRYRDLLEQVISQLPEA